MITNLVSLDVAIRYHDQASAVLDSVTGRLNQNMEVLNKFMSRLDIFGRNTAGAMARIAASQAANIQSTKEMSQQYNISIEQLEKFRYATAKTGTSLQQTLDLRQRLYDMGLKQYRLENMDQIQRLRQLQVLKTGNDLTDNTEKVMRNLGLAYLAAQKSGKGYDEIVLALGDNAQYMIPMLAKMAETMNEVDKAKGGKLAIANQEDINAAEDFNRSVAEAEQVIRQFALTIWRVIAPAVKIFIDNLKESMKFTKWWGDAFAPAITVILKFVATLFSAIDAIHRFLGPVASLIYLLAVIYSYTSKASMAFMALMLVLQAIREPILGTTVFMVFLIATIAKFITGADTMGKALGILAAKIWGVAVATTAMKVVLSLGIAAIAITMAIIASTAKVEDEAARSTKRMSEEFNQANSSIYGTDKAAKDLSNTLKYMDSEDWFGNLLQRIQNMPNEVMPALMASLRSQNDVINQAAQEELNRMGARTFGVGSAAGALNMLPQNRESLQANFNTNINVNLENIPSGTLASVSQQTPTGNFTSNPNRGT